jgi:hypothetical protein|tara:strand:+ start:746 stop:1201 length:456 start_codon:yes stop_codon:yes gene_type:complete
MALKPDRVEALTDLSFFMNETGERGVILTHNSAGSGASMDDNTATVVVATGTGDYPAGLLLCDVVNLDLTRQHINYAKDEVQKGGKVLLLRRGWVVTNKVEASPSTTIVAGSPAYFMSNGEVTPDAGSAQIGRFLSVKDADGYVKVEIDIV